MAIARNLAFRNQVVGSAVGRFPQNAVFEVRTGAPPGPDNAATGTLLVSFTLSAASPWNAASGGASTLANTPIVGTAVAAGTAGYFRLRNAGNTELLEGNVTATGGGGDLTLDNVVIANGQTVNLTGFTISVPA